MMVWMRWAIAISVQSENCSRTVSCMSASVSTSTLAVASSSTRICTRVKVSAAHGLVAASAAASAIAAGSLPPAALQQRRQGSLGWAASLPVTVK